MFWLAWCIIQTGLLIYYGLLWPYALADAIPSTTLLGFACMLAANNLSFYHPIRNKYVFWLVLSGALTLFWILIVHGLLEYVYRSNPHGLSLLKLSLPIRFFFGFIMIGGTAAMSLLWYSIEEQDDLNLREQASEKLAREAELFKLRQQLNPHFLFNSLNSISSLILTRSSEARDMIHKLSDFLRGTLKKEDQQLVDLSEELQYLQLYLDIEKVRFGQRLHAAISCSAEAAARKLPPMLLQPVAENAIKFGLYDRTGEVNIRISASILGDYLEIRVENPFDPATAGANRGTGFGLSAVRRRLYLLYARQDLLETTIKDELFITRIKIPRIYDQGNHH